MIEKNYPEINDLREHILKFVTEDRKIMPWNFLGRINMVCVNSGEIRIW